ncbi:SLC13 family permease [Lignipirellula cremea]|uniref:Sodium-dependent dicarboxylate transporter SdcS n=1 Tax=Lignipirellula cremea TaxID=2528010 RepID=A0A518DXS9_9BACT|nr:SLC13 family permease [Lignipirellula cremea]QDU96650.1 Sodium-dependent dicarboxylate transporter SdcS [Lignipirellula cremea]
MTGNAQRILIFGGIVCACLTYAGLRFWAELDQPAAVTAAVTTLCALWWCTEAIPIAVTALLPFVMFPLCGVLDDQQLAAAYGDDLVLLFLAGFIISKAAEKSKTHLRVAHGMLRLLGTGSQRRLVLGFMLAPAVCSMWISNAATALIMLPVALAALEQQKDRRLEAPLLLAVAYGCSIGGMATIIGTPPNAVFVGVYRDFTDKSVDFLSWMAVGAPVTVLMLIAAGALLTRGLGRGSEYELQDLGPWKPAQRRMLLVLGCTALLWMLRKSPAGGWSAWLGNAAISPEHYAGDATIGLAAVVLMFLIPSGEVDKEGRSTALLDWETAVRIPWGILLLFGGGLAIASAFQSTGLGELIGANLAMLQHFPPILIIGVICLAVTFLTELTSNTATTTLLMPILAAAAQGAGLEPAVLMAPAALSASCAFMLPVATPPNAIVFGSNRLTIPQMARPGFVLNLIGVVVITGVCYFVVDFEHGIGSPAEKAAPVETTAESPSEPAPDSPPQTDKAAP